MSNLAALLDALGDASDAALYSGSANAKLAALLAPTATFPTPTNDAHISFSVPFDGGVATVLAVTNPGTVLTTAFDITGKGILHALAITKVATVNSVSARIRLTIDGVIWIPDDGSVGSATDAATGAKHGLIVGAGAYTAGAVQTSGLVPSFIEFQRSCKVQVKFSGTPGGTENIQAYYIVQYR